jgi:hypothetical protein
MKDTLSPALRKLQGHLVGNLLDAMNMTCAIARDAAKSGHEYKDRTGGVTAATREIPATYKDGKITGGVENTSKVGLFLHEGTGLYGPNKAPYEIKPKNGKALHFEIAGSVQGNEAGKGVFAKRVMHPGIKPDPFISRAVHKTKAIFKRNMAGAIKRTMKQSS